MYGIFWSPEGTWLNQLLCCFRDRLFWSGPPHLTPKDQGSRLSIPTPFHLHVCLQTGGSLTNTHTTSSIPRTLKSTASCVVSLSVTGLGFLSTFHFSNLCKTIVYSFIFLLATAVVQFCCVPGGYFCVFMYEQTWCQAHFLLALIGAAWPVSNQQSTIKLDIWGFLKWPFEFLKTILLNLEKFNTLSCFFAMAWGRRQTVFIGHVILGSFWGPHSGSPGSNALTGSMA